MLLRNEKSVSVFILQAIQPTRKMSIRKRSVANKIKILRALYQILARTNINVLQIKDVHYKILAKQLKIPQKTVKNVITEWHPTVKLQ